MTRKLVNPTASKMPKGMANTSTRLIRIGHDILIKRDRTVDSYALIEQKNVDEKASTIIILNSEIPDLIECLQQYMENLRR